MIQLKLTCGYFPHDENYFRNGQCEGCEYAEGIIPILPKTAYFERRK